jgi:magnesium chelatase subunit I
MVCFTANPEDYSRSGKIISQLKDRIGSEIRTHYPKSRKVGLDVTRQEISLPISNPPVKVPEFIEEIIEEITIQARSSHLVNQKSCVSARLSISNYEVAMSSARRRALKN